MRLTLSSEGVRNTTMTNEDGQVLYKTSTPFRFGARTTTLYKVVPNTDPDDMRDHLERIGEIEWNLIGSSVMRLRGQEMMTDTFIPRHGIRGRWYTHRLRHASIELMFFQLHRKRTFEGPDGLPYRWDMDFKFVRLSRDDTTRQELARSYRRSLGIIGPRRDPFLDVDLNLMHMLDTVVLTFVYVEKLRMDKEKRAKRNHGGGGP
ncbi:hypothetical protein F5141DRAFT_1008601 [Pisolithus sp. B1]|nr:hypothetical protein F5141DRAFT_1008601 [Pisolithus sp. B1]